MNSSRFEAVPVAEIVSSSGHPACREAEKQTWLRRSKFPDSRHNQLAEGMPSNGKVRENRFAVKCRLSPCHVAGLQCGAVKCHTDIAKLRLRFVEDGIVCAKF
jgi:hypothetical protein